MTKDIAFSTVFAVSEYSPKSDGSMLLRLIKGSARAVTGFFADAQSRRYQFTTPAATAGIRGTSFQVTYCLQSRATCPTGSTSPAATARSSCATDSARST